MDIKGGGVHSYPGNDSFTFRSQYGDGTFLPSFPVYYLLEIHKKFQDSESLNAESELYKKATSGTLVVATTEYVLCFCFGFAI